jgi:hypothetical protein
MHAFLWRVIVWLWIRRATNLYGFPSTQGELFSTACFQTAIKQTTGTGVSKAVAAMWLRDFGYVSGNDGCRWYRSVGHLNESMLRGYK